MIDDQTLRAWFVREILPLESSLTAFVRNLTPYVGQPEDIGAMAVYLCSEDGRFITGQAINVDGGINAHMPYYAEMQNLNVKWDIPLTPGAESAA